MWNQNVTPARVRTTNNRDICTGDLWCMVEKGECDRFYLETPASTILNLDKTPSYQEGNGISFR